MRRTLHLLTNHWWGYSHGKVQGFWIGEEYWVGFYCSCGEIIAHLAGEEDKI